jgi:hypothetical protein
MTCSSRDLWPRETIEVATLAFGRPARAALAHCNPWLPLYDRGGRTLVDQALGRDCRPDSLIDDDRDLEDALALHERLDAVTDLHLRRRLGCATVDANMAATAAGRRRRTGLIDPNGP